MEFNSHIAGVKDVSDSKFIALLSAHLKRQGKIEIPKWVDYVKTGHFKELAPIDPDWLYVRAASMARKIYIRKGTGVGGFRKVYGGQKRNGTCKNKYVKGSGKITRYLLQKLEEIGLVEQLEAGGRKITSEGQRELDLVACRCGAEDEE